MLPKTDVAITELVDRCRRGDERAWRALVDRYARLVHAVALRHGLRAGEVEDVGQEVFLALARSLHEIDDPERLPGWLATTTRRASWRMVQARRRETEWDDVSQDTATPTTPLATASMPSLTDLLHTWQRQEALHTAFSRLQARCRDLLTMLFLDPEEPNYDDIAARLDIPKGSIGPTRTRCLEKMRTLMEALDHGRDLI